MGLAPERKLSPIEYLKQLQKEYVLTKVRLAIYNLQKDLNYYSRVLAQKEADITSMAIRNGFTKTVLNDCSKFDEFADGLLADGYPKFMYYSNAKNRHAVERVEKLDFIKYYRKNVKVELIDSKETGTVLYADFENKTVKISFKAGVRHVRFENVKRKNFKICF